VKGKMWKTLVCSKYGKAYCPWCGKGLRTPICARRHFKSDHCPPGYVYRFTELPPSISNRILGRARYRIELEGPCRCGCGEILKFPWSGGQMPPSPPPYFKIGHRITVTHGNSGSFEPGIKPWNTGLKLDMPRNSGMFTKGHIPVNYKGGIATGHGVVMRLGDGLYPCGVRRRVNVAREVGAQLVGRPLKKGEVALHKDGDWRNNSMENIVVVTRKESITRNRAKLHRGRGIVPKVAEPVPEACYKVAPRACTNALVQERKTVPFKTPRKIPKKGTDAPTGIWATRGGQFCKSCHQLMGMSQSHICKVRM